MTITYVDSITDDFFNNPDKFYNEAQLLIHKILPQYNYDFDEVFFQTYCKLWKYKDKLDLSKSITALMYITFKNTYFNHHKRKMNPRFKEPKFVNIDDYINNLYIDNR